MSIELYPSIAKIKRNGVYENLPGFIPETGSVATQQMIATAESSATAQYVHNKGEYFRLNDTLYQAIVKINVGDAIVVGTNCEVAVIGNDLTHVANSIAAYELGIATSSHNTGGYFMVNETMYVATADIQVGDNISTSTNCRLAVVGDELSGLKTAIIEDVSDTNYANIRTFTEKSASSVSATRSFSGNYVDVTYSGSASYVAFSQVTSSFTLKAGHKYRFHAVISTVSGNPALMLAVRGKEGNVHQIAVSLQGAGEQTVDFVATGYEKYISIFGSRASGTTYNGTARYSDIWLKEVVNSAIDVDAQKSIDTIKKAISEPIMSLFNISAYTDENALNYYNQLRMEFEQPLCGLLDHVTEDSGVRVTTTHNGHIKVEILESKTTTNNGFAINLVSGIMGALGTNNIYKQLMRFVVPSGKLICEISNVKNDSEIQNNMGIGVSGTSNAARSFNIITAPSGTVFVPMTISSDTNFSVPFLYLVTQSLAANTVIEMDVKVYNADTRFI